MMNFDNETNRCYDCDGKLTHHQGCPFFVSPSPLTVADRLAVQAMLAGIDATNPPF